MPDEQWPIAITVEEPYGEAVDPERLARAARATLAHVGAGSAELAIVVTDDATVRAYNRTYRGVDRATDVLSFAAQEGAPFHADLPPEVVAEIERYLGDLVIAFPYAAAQARGYGHSIEAELQLLVVHGTLHLLGYDHDTDPRQEEMWALQSQVLASLLEEDLTRRIDDEAGAEG